MMRRLPALMALLFLAACGGGGSDSSGGGSGGGGSNVVVAVSPATAALTPSGAQQFTCTVTGATQTGCTWSVTETAGGAVTTGGLYTAPSTAGTYHVVATSVADTTKRATATVTVAPSAAPKAWVTGYYVGYYWDWDLAQPPESLDMTAMTHLVFGRVAPGGGSLDGQPGQVVLGGGTSHDPNTAPDGGSVEDYLIKKAHAVGTKALLMLGGDGEDGIGFLLSTTDAMRPLFVKRVVDYMVAHNYDGVDVDWENELEGNADLRVSAAEARRRLKALIVELREEASFRPRYSGPGKAVIITYPSYAKSINDLEPGGKVEQWLADIANLVDQFNLMSYGVGTAFNGAEWDSWFSGPIFGATPSRPIDLNTSVNAYVATGVPRGKIGIGMGFYGMYFGPEITGPRQNTNNNEIWETNDNALAYFELVRKGYLSHGTYHWDEEAKVGYRTYGPGGYIPAVDPNSNPAGFLTYEDERSIAAKGAWVRETGLGGTIIWTVNYGYLVSTKTNPLLAATKRAFLE